MSKKLLQILDNRGYTAYRLASRQSSAVHELVDVERKLAGVAELLMFADFSSFQPENLTGVGLVLESLAEEVSQIRNHLDECSVATARRGEEAE